MINWFDVAKYDTKLRANNFFIGGRGIGKTFSAFSYIYKLQPFIYVRNTEVQLDECSSEFGNPFKKWNKVTGHNIRMRKEKKHSLIVEDEGDNEHVIGYGASLSGQGALRGIDMSDVKIGVLDEFIELKNLQFNQGAAYDQLYETVNRNRELEGEGPFKFLLLSNAQRLNNSILARKDLITPIEGMMKSGQETWSRGDSFVCLPVCEVSDLKAQTAFYSAIKGSKTYAEAIENKFANDSFYAIKKRPLAEYIGVCQIDDIYIYKHKSNGKYYACSSQCLNIPVFSSKDNFSLFYRTYGRQFDIMASCGDLECSDFTIKSRLYEILRI